MNFAVAITHRVHSINDARQLLCQHFDFSLQKEVDGQVELSNGAMSILLIEDKLTAIRPLCLAVNANDIKQSASYFLLHGFQGDRKPQWVGNVRQEIYLQGTCGIDVNLYRDYNEDELSIVPELPSLLDWEDEADHITRELLKSVPVSFRETARDRVTQMAESDSIVEGDMVVTLEVACKAMFKAAPEFQHNTLKQAMRDCGLNPDHYQYD